MGLPSEEDVEDSFRAIGTNDVAQLEAARKYTEPGSVAEAYAIYLLT